METESGRSAGDGDFVRPRPRTWAGAVVGAAALLLVAGVYLALVRWHTAVLASPSLRRVRPPLGSRRERSCTC